MSNNFVDVLVIGGGVVGLAIAKTFAAERRDVLVVERENTFGSVTSSRNSGVIHAGVYYDQNSLKAKFCAPGNKRIYEYCNKFKIPHVNTGKFIVACSKDEIPKLNEIYEKAGDNGVEGIEKVTGDYVSQVEPLVECEEALFVPSSGIVDQTSLMRSYLGELELSGSIAYNSKFIKSELKNNKHISTILNEDHEIKIESSILINAAGLYAEDVAKSISSMDKTLIPKTYFAKGNYFETSKDLNIRHLIYPIPNEASLGLHLGLDIGMQVRFGPDVEWIDEINYDVDENRLESFYNDIRKYLPTFDKGLLKKGYSGVRPKLKNRGEGKSDFMIQGEEIHKTKNLINLFGIESPGLTSSLVLGEHIVEMVS